ncbi:CocE/NonD family hydrolase [Kribbella sp. NBC_01245]|uniref:CocE/NonD family hydrolase n=1 Tax=Kribbella sp. NBC_01245 TaxID=2903578 RepID=UPI002E2DA992|nr:CocE/NonD family hydrolase [Kribbella sp. NBC_01245]
MKRLMLVLCLLLAALSAATAATAATDSARVCEEKLVSMSDGVRLHTWVSRVAPDKPRPVLLEIESYARPGNKCPTFLPGDYYPHFLSPELIDRFTLVHVSYRGAGSSEGVFDLTGPDTQRDVREVIAWAADQPWSTGDIVLTGQSGTGFAAHHGLREPAVRAAVIYTSCADMYRCFRRGGADNGLPGVYLAGTESGYLGALADRLRLGTSTNPIPVEQQAAFVSALAATKAHDVNDGFWSARSALDKLPGTTIPVLYTTDPYDIVQSFDAYQRTPNARLVLGMGHTSVEPAVASDGRHAELVRRQVDRFVAHYGLGDDNGAEHDPRVVVATTTGSNARWRAGEALVRNEASWPLPGTNWTRLYLDSGPSGTASSLNDGTLSAVPPEIGADVAPVISFPNSRGDFRTTAWLAGSAARTDQRDDERSGLTYTTPELTRNVELTGPITLRLVASSTAPDLDWAVRLTDVWPDGRSEWISDGHLRATLRQVDQQKSLRNAAGEVVRPWHRFDTVQPVPLAQPVEYLVEVAPLSNVFRSGHRIRLDILPVAGSSVDVRLGGAGAVTIHRGASSVLVPLIPARCQRSVPLLPFGEPPARCATSWTEAIR